MDERANLIALAVAIVGIPTAVLTLMAAVFNLRENKKELPAEALPALELVKRDPPPNAYRAYTREKYGHYAYVSACLLMTVGGLALLLTDRELATRPAFCCLWSGWLNARQYSSQSEVSLLKV